MPTPGGNSSTSTPRLSTALRAGAASKTRMPPTSCKKSCAAWPAAGRFNYGPVKGTAAGSIP